MSLPDLGSSHVIDWYLHKWSQQINAEWMDVWDPDSIGFDPDDWSRYDGELL